MNREELILRARDIVNQDVVIGAIAEPLKVIANTDLEKFERFLKEISEQAWDPAVEQSAIKAFSKELVDISKELFPADPNYPYINLDEVKTLIKKRLHESLLGESKEHTDDEIVDFNEIDLQHEYNKLNQLLFKGGLQPVTMLWNKRKGAHGVVKGTRNRSTGKITLKSLSMSQFLKVPYRFFKDVLAHEMIHVFWMQQDVNAKHGPLFVQQMNRINSMGLGFKVSVRSDSSETSKFEMSADVVKQGMELVFLLMDTDKDKNMFSVMKYEAYKEQGYRILSIYNHLVNEKPKYKFANGEFFLSTNPRLQAAKIQRSFGSISYSRIDDTIANDLKKDAKLLCKFEINDTYDKPHVEGPDQPYPERPNLLGF